MSSGRRCADDPSLIEVLKPKGKLIQRLGFSRGTQTFLRLEEAAWLADQGQLLLTLEGGDADRSDGPGALLVSLLAKGYRIEVYGVFTMLSELGYVVQTRRPVPLPAADATEPPLKRQRTAAAGSSGGAGSGAQHAPLGPDSIPLDVWSPDKTFKRSAPGSPDYVISVCDIAEPPPSASQITRLAAQESGGGGGTVMHAMASGAEAQLMALLPRPSSDFDLTDNG